MADFTEADFLETIKSFKTFWAIPIKQLIDDFLEKGNSIDLEHLHNRMEAHVLGESKIIHKYKKALEKKADHSQPLTARENLFLGLYYFEYDTPGTACTYFKAAAEQHSAGLIWLGKLQAFGTRNLNYFQQALQQNDPCARFYLRKEHETRMELEWACTQNQKLGDPNSFILSGHKYRGGMDNEKALENFAGAGKQGYTEALEKMEYILHLSPEVSAYANYLICKYTRRGLSTYAMSKTVGKNNTNLVVICFAKFILSLNKNNYELLNYKKEIDRKFNDFVFNLNLKDKSKIEPHNITAFNEIFKLDPEIALFLVKKLNINQFYSLLSEENAKEFLAYKEKYSAIMRDNTGLFDDIIRYTLFEYTDKKECVAEVTQLKL